MIDLGWVSHAGPSLPLVRAADTVVIVTRPELAEIQSLLFQVRQVQAAGGEVALVTIGSVPNDPAEIAELAGVRLAAVLPDDATIAAGLRGAEFAPKKFRRSLLWRTICALADSLLDVETMRERSSEVVPTALSAQVPPPPPGPGHHGVPTPSRGAETLDSAPTHIPDQARLVLPDGSGWTLNAGSPISIGRHPQCEVVLDDSLVSRRHATIRHTDQGWRLTDLGSRNGVNKNGRACTEAELEPGDVVAIGRHTFRFEFVAQPQTPSAALPDHDEHADPVNNHEMECA